MKCCSDPYLMEELDECGCEIIACFNCNEVTIRRWCSLHNPEGVSS